MGDLSLDTKSEAPRAKTPALLGRLSVATQVWLFKGVVKVALGALRLTSSSDFRKVAPTYIKRYDVRPMLENRVFIPNSYKPGEKLSLYIDIHGGGFAIGDPQFDDRYCHYMANKYGYCVVSLDYRLAPTYPFPTAVEDCSELALAVLADNDLPADHDKVVMGGFSAGGNLALATAQHPKLQGKIKALVPVYPVVDWSSKYKGEFRDKPADSNGKGGEKDRLRATTHLFEWAYCDYGQDLLDPRLSPIYADRSTLPPKIYFATVQYDKLTHETFEMAKLLAKYPDAREDELWDRNGIAWDRVPNAMHGLFESDWKGDNGNENDPWYSVTKDLIARIATWLDGALQGTK